MEWVKPEFSREEINRAGKLVLRSMKVPEDGVAESFDWREFDRALAILNNWRSSHGYPLISLRMNLTAVANRFDKKPLIAQRIKRLISITAKLDRQPTMKLSQMQDLGGCRAIFSNVATVQKAVTFYKNATRALHELASTDDYIQNPKASGYRGVHLVYRFRSTNKRKLVYNGLKIELQLRSTYQHAWATAVETVGTFSGQALKSSLGSEQWQKFFVLMSSEIAFREKTPVVPGTPMSRDILRRELRKYARDLKVEERLKGYRRAVKAMSTLTKKNASFFLLQLNPAAGRLRVEGYDNISEAEGAYEAAEALVRKQEGTDAVLVAVESVAALDRAYPNYFADTRVFLQLMNQALSGKSRGIEFAPATVLQLESENRAARAEK